MSAPQPGDKSAAFRGLVVTTVLLVTMAATIVFLTNRRFASHTAPETPAAQH